MYFFLVGGTETEKTAPPMSELEVVRGTHLSDSSDFITNRRGVNMQNQENEKIIKREKRKTDGKARKTA